MLPLLHKINQLIVNPVIYFMMGLALVYFMWGVVKYITNADDPAERTAGARHMIWGIVGLTIMFGVFGIINIIINTIGAR